MVGEVIRSLRAGFPEAGAIVVVDDGSRDDTALVAAQAGVRVVRHAKNLGKGAAIRTGLEAARNAGFDVAVTVDADGQHPGEEAVRVRDADPDPAALVLGIRDLARAGAPRANQMSNRISNFFLSLFSGQRLSDTQCGLRRYPVALTLELGGRDDGYAFEAEIILRALAGGLRVVEAPIDVVYPPEEERVTHFDSVRDPMRIIARVLRTLAATRGMRRAAPRAKIDRAPGIEAPPQAPAAARAERPAADA